MVEYAELLQTARRIAQRASQVTDEGDDALLTNKQAESLIPRLNPKVGKKDEGKEYNFMNDMFNKLYSDNQELKKSLQGDAPKVNKISPKEAAFLKNDEAFMTRLNQMIEKYPGLTENEVFNIIKGESAFDPRATNKSGATGLFQMMPDSAKEIGFSTAEILEMAPAEQLAVYDAYLARWGYDGSYGLGVLQAAPAYRKASPDTEIYKKGSAAWKQNPGWRGKDGRITKRSIEAYYGRTE